eukprot:6182726-Pleurochrysis_carterae.AAC.1
MYLIAYLSSQQLAQRSEQIVTSTPAMISFISIPNVAYSLSGDRCLLRMVLASSTSSASHCTSATEMKGVKCRISVHSAKIATICPTRRWESGDGMAALIHHCPTTC